jgi:triacylglycerol lipase
MTRVSTLSTLPLRRVLCSLALSAVAAAASAQTAPPTSASLNATAGPLAVSSVAISGATGFGGGTIYYPQAAGSYGVIAISPGYGARGSSLAWLARRLATHGFVVAAINTTSTMDSPPSRGPQLMAALDHVVNKADANVRSRADGSRMAVMGHSAGGGGALVAARDNPTLKAAVALTPGSFGNFYSGVRVPTIIFGADGDTITPVTSQARPAYNSIPVTTPKAYGELNNATHLTPVSTNTPIGRYSVAWAKRFVDGDTRYSPFLCGAEHAAYATTAVFDQYLSTCPY